MVLKDWTKVGYNTWQRNGKKGMHSIKIRKFRKHWHVEIDLGVGKRSLGVSGSNQFKKKSQALEFARVYRKKH